MFLYKQHSKKIFLIISCAIVFVILFPSTFFSTVSAKEYEGAWLEISAPKGMFVVGEELTYEVSYTVFDLGTIKFQVVDTVNRNGATVYRAKAFIDSYSIPLVNLHFVFYSEMHPEPYSFFFISHDTKNPNEKYYTKYQFNYTDNTVAYERGIQPKNIITTSGNAIIAAPQQDGLSLFYYARQNARQKKEMNSPIFLNEKSFNTYFNFMDKIGKQEIAAVHYPIETVEFDGRAEFTGIFGMTGGFQGFFSNDEASIPIVAKMKVLLGSIHIELKSWKRPGWNPPKAQ